MGRDQDLGVQCGPRALSRPPTGGAARHRTVRAGKDHNQRWGFLAPEVRERYANHGAEMLSTAEAGAVRFRIADGVGSPVRYRDETARYWNAR